MVELLQFGATLRHTWSTDGRVLSIAVTGPVSAGGVSDAVGDVVATLRGRASGGAVGLLIDLRQAFFSTSTLIQAALGQRGRQPALVDVPVAFIVDRVMLTPEIRAMAWRGACIGITVSAFDDPHRAERYLARQVSIAASRSQDPCMGADLHKG
jgi:hypothetical protein